MIDLISSQSPTPKNKFYKKCSLFSKLAMQDLTIQNE